MAEAKDIASAAQVKRIIRRKIRRQEPPEENFLNIYPMMDMMTILLVFLLMQFSQSTAEIVPLENLQIPKSRSEEIVEAALTVTVSRDDILIKGNKVVSLRNGQVDPSEKQGGAKGFLITPMLKDLQQRRDRIKLIAQRKGTPFSGEVRIVADRRTPYRTLTEVIHTLGQSEFSQLRFVVLEGGS